MEEGKIVYLKMAELHPFHTFREHPYKVQDDKAMDDLVGTIKEHGIMTPATVRPEKDGKGYEIIAGHRRHHGGTRAGLEEMPCIVREMTDLEAVREMRNSNKQRGDPLPSELAKLLDLEVEAIKRQGARPKSEKEAEALGKLSVEIVGKEHDMNYKKVMRYIRLNSLVPELLDKVDTKQMGFMPAVEISYIKMCIRDSYITKPFSVRELIARVKALLRRAQAQNDEEGILRVGPLVIDTSNYEAFRNGEKLSLTLKEFELLKLLVISRGKVLTRDFLLDRIWGYEFYGETRTVDVHIRHIRQKLGDDAHYIETIRGVG